MINKTFTFRDKDIDFIVDNNNNVKVNATQMAQAFKKDVRDFTVLKQTDNFINSCLKTENSRFLAIEKKEDLIISKQKSGTWMHEVLALKFAAWLDSDFEVWVFTTIRNILHDYSAKKEESIKKTVQLKRKRDSLKNRLYKENQDFKTFVEIENQLKEEQYKRRSNTLQRFKEEWNLFSNIPQKDTE